MTVHTDHINAAALPLPPVVRAPRALQGIGYAVFRRQTIALLAKRHGHVFTIRIPVFGNMVVVTDPALAKQVFTASTEDLGNIQPNLSRIFGPGSVFALEGAASSKRRPSVRRRPGPTAASSPRSSR
jgi:cytochrome P450 family 138